MKKRLGSGQEADDPVWTRGSLRSQKEKWDSSGACSCALAIEMDVVKI